MEKPTKTTLDGTPLQPGHAEYDEAARKELDRRKASIERRRESGDEAAWREGFDFIVVRDRKLHRQDGIGGMTGWVLRLGRSPAHVRKRMRLAECFSLAQVKQHHVEKLELVLDYVGLSLGEDDSWQLETLEVTVPGTRAGTVVSVRAEDATVPQLLAALAHQRDLARRRGRDLPSGEDGVVTDLNDAVLDGDRKLAEISGRPSESGHLDDLDLTIRVRNGDLEAVIHRLQQRLSARKAPRRGRG